MSDMNSELFVSDHGPNLLSVDMRNGSVLYAYHGMQTSPHNRTGYSFRDFQVSPDQSTVYPNRLNS